MFNSVMFGLTKPLGSLEKVSKTKKAETPKESFWPIKKAEKEMPGRHYSYDPIYRTPLKVSGQAVDIETLKRHGIRNGQENNPNGAAQVAGNKNTEVTYKGDPQRPDEIIIKDSTNGQANTYVYKKVQTNDPPSDPFGPRRKPLYEANNRAVYGTGVRYVLVSVTNSKGKDIMRHDHKEEYELVFNPKEALYTGEYVYNLIQTKDMEGSNQSSIHYNKRRG